MLIENAIIIILVCFLAIFGVLSACRIIYCTGYIWIIPRRNMDAAKPVRYLIRGLFYIEGRRS